MVFSTMETSRGLSDLYNVGFPVRYKDDILKKLSQGGKAVLDIGCGDGTLLKELHKVKSSEPNNFTGIDISKPHSTQGFDFIHASIDKPEVLGQKKYDIIIAVASLHYVDDFKTALVNIQKALKPNGKAILTLEPYYLGPWGIAAIDKCSQGMQWAGDYNGLPTVIIVEPGDGSKVMQGLHKHLVPNDLLVSNGFHHAMLGVTSSVIDWEKFVMFILPRVSSVAFNGKRLPFARAAKRMYFFSHTLSPNDIVRLLMTPINFVGLRLKAEPGDLRALKGNSLAHNNKTVSPAVQSELELFKTFVGADISLMKLWVAKNSADSNSPFNKNKKNPEAYKNISIKASSTRNIPRCSLFGVVSAAMVVGAAVYFGLG